jgi:mersacidin/lichenicidin family type 2 lantibiotic
MSTVDIIRAWKDEEYRMSLSAAELAQLPQNPVGMVELDDADLADASGQVTTWVCFTVAVSAATSCVPSCAATVWDGTCNVGSVGC